MIRNCTEIPLDDFRIEFGIRSIFNVSLFVDEENHAEILKILSENTDRFRRAVFELLQGRYNNELYGKEDISDKTKNITAFKFKKRRGTNYRIYCKEYIDDFSPNMKKVVMIQVYNKKTRKIDKKLKQLLESIAKYEYEI
ncbi:MAG: hypothetical protein GXO86_13925 [Chlorobi bacterium]|nr:hypothetical protein [Chlorobiota bacterium]